MPAPPPSLFPYFLRNWQLWTADGSRAVVSLPLPPTPHTTVSVDVVLFAILSYRAIRARLDLFRNRPTHSPVRKVFGI